MRIVKKYWLPLLALVFAIGLAVWRIGYLERTNTSLSMEIGSREALQNGEPITLENPVILYKNEPYVPLYEVVERLGGTTTAKPIHCTVLRPLSPAWNGMACTRRFRTCGTPFRRYGGIRAATALSSPAPDEIPLTRRWLFWRHKTVRGLRVGDSEARFLDLYGSPDARDETMVDLLHVTIENGIVTEIFMGRYE
ncbi:MAG: stalk domain-containing protein [Butyricicoccaceae bacterium]